MLKLLYLGWAILMRRSKVPCGPINLQLDITNYCNLECKMCFRNELPKDSCNNANIPVGKFKLIIDTFKPLYLNMGPGGEPLLHPQFFEMVKYAKQKGIKVIVSTNGTTLANNNVAEKLVKCGLDALKISIDAPDRETYKQIRKQDYFDKIVEGIDKISHSKRRLQSSCPGLRFDIVLLKGNYNRLVDILKLANQKSISYVFFRALNYAGFSESNIKNLIGEFGIGDLKRELMKAYDFANINKIKTNLRWFTNNVEEIFSLYDPESRGRTIRLKKKPVCILPWVSLLIDVKGRMSYCCRLFNTLEEKGDLFKKQDIGNFWNSKDFQRTRHIYADKYNYRIHETCNQCTDLISAWGALNTIRLFPTQKA